MPLGNTEEYRKQFEANLNLARNNLARAIEDSKKQSLGNTTALNIHDVYEPLPEDFLKPSYAKGVSGYIGMFGSGLGQVVGGIPAAVGVVEGAITGDDYRETQGYKAAQAVEDFASDKSVDPTIKDAFSGKVTQGLGQAAGFLAAGFLPGGPLTAIGAGAGMGGKALYDDAISKGADEDTAYSAALQGALIGTSEAFPFLHAANRFLGGKTRGLVKALGSAVITGGEELVQEGLQTLGENAVAKVTAGYDPDRAWFESVSEAAAVGGTTGFIADILLNTLGRRLRSGPTLQVNKGKNRNLKYSVNPDSDLGRAYELSVQKKAEGEKNREQLFNSLDYTNIPNTAAQLRGDDTTVFTNQNIAKSAAKLTKYMDAVPGSIAHKIKEENVRSLATDYIFNPDADVHVSREAMDALSSVGLKPRHIERLRDKFLREVGAIQGGGEDVKAKVGKLKDEYTDNLDNLNYEFTPAPQIDSSSVEYTDPRQTITIADNREQAVATESTTTPADTGIILNAKNKPFKEKKNTTLRINTLAKQGKVAEPVELPNGKGWGIRIVSETPAIQPTPAAGVPSVPPSSPVQQANSAITETPTVTPTQGTTPVVEASTNSQEASQPELPGNLAITYDTAGEKKVFIADSKEAAQRRIKARKNVDNEYDKAIPVEYDGGWAIDLNPVVQQPTEVTQNGQETSTIPNEVQQIQGQSIPNETSSAEGQGQQKQGLLKAAKPKAEKKPRKSKTFAVSKNIQVDTPFTPVNNVGDPVFKAGGMNPTTGRMKHDGTNFQLELENGTWITPVAAIQKRLRQHKAVDAAMPRAAEGKGTSITEQTHKEMSLEEDKKNKLIADEATRAKLEAKLLANLNEQYSDESKLNIKASIKQAQDNAAAGITDNIKGELNKKYGINLSFSQWVRIANGLKTSDPVDDSVLDITPGVTEAKELTAPEILELASPPVVEEKPSVPTVEIKPNPKDTQPKPKRVITPRKTRKVVDEDDEFAETNGDILRRTNNLDDYNPDETTMDDLEDIGFVPFDNGDADYSWKPAGKIAAVHQEVSWKKMMLAITKFRNAVIAAGNKNIDFVVYRTKEEYLKARENDPSLEGSLSKYGDKLPKGWRRKMPNGRDEIAILAFTHHSDIDVGKTLLHETVGHYGMETLFGNKFKAFIQRLADTNPKLLRIAYNTLASTYEVMGRKPVGRERLGAGERFVTDVNGDKIAILTADETHTLLKEYIAKISEEYSDPAKRAIMEKGTLAAIKRVYAYIKHLLRSVVNFEVTEEDIHALIRESYARLMNEDGFSFSDQIRADIYNTKVINATKDVSNSELGRVMPGGQRGIDYVNDQDTLSTAMQKQELTTKTLAKEYGAKEVTDELGHTWFEVSDISKYASEPVIAFNINNQISLSIAANPQEMADVINEPVENVIAFHEMTKNHERQIPFLSGFSSYMKGVQRVVDTSTRGVFDLFGNVANSGVLKGLFRRALGDTGPTEKLSVEVDKMLKKAKLSINDNKDLRIAWLSGAVHDGTYNPDYLTKLQVSMLRRLSREFARIQSEIIEKNLPGVPDAVKKKMIDTKGRWLHQDYLETVDKGYLGHGWLTSALDWQKRAKVPEGSKHMEGAIMDSRYSIVNSVNLIANDYAKLSLYDNIVKLSKKLGTHWAIIVRGKHAINGESYSLPRLHREIAALEQALNTKSTQTILSPQEEADLEGKLKILTDAALSMQTSELEATREAMIASGGKYSKLDVNGKPILDEKTGRPIGDGLIDLYEGNWQKTVGAFLADQYVFIDPKNNKYDGLGALRGYHLDKRIYDVIYSNADYVANASKDWASTMFSIAPGSSLDRGNSLWKGQMTVYNPTYWVRAFLGSVVSMDLATNTNSFTMGRYLFEEIQNAFIKTADEKQPLYGGRPLSDWGLRKGAFSGGYSQNELYAIRYGLKESGALEEIKEALDKKDAKGTGLAIIDFTINGYFKLGKALARMNVNMDAMFKLALMRDFLETHAKQHGFSSGEAIANHYYKSENGKAKLNALMENAVAHSAKGIPEYYDIPLWMEKLRRLPLGAPFITFNYKMFGIYQRAALARPWKLAKYHLFGYAVLQALIAASDWDEDELKKAIDSLPIHMRNKSTLMIIPFKDSSGNVHYADLSYTLPQAFIYDTFLKMMNPTPGQSQIGAVGTALAETTGILSGPIPKVLTAIIAKKDPFTGRDLWVEGDSFDANLARYAKFMWNLAAPPWAAWDLFGGGTGGGILSDTYNVNFKDEFGKDKNPYWSTDVASFVSGANIKTYRPQDQVVRNMRFITAKVKEVELQRSKVMRDANLSVEDKVAKLKDISERIRELNLSRSKYSGI